MFTYTVPCVNLDEFTEADINKLKADDRKPEEVLYMRDEKDAENGFFLWIDDPEPEQFTPAPQGFSEQFQKVWRWAQAHRYTWIRLAAWGDSIDS